ncbi:MAG: carbohydrate ABC transporter permease [Chloroflexi bacterium]|nr:MAG: carbohydrate ABC transporter permease [Chloroflexota bacterium]
MPDETRRWTKALWYIPILLVAIAFAFPIVWMVMTSFKTRVDAFALPPKFIFTPTLQNYRNVIASPFMSSVVNSVIIALVSTGFSLSLGCLTAYGFSRYRIRAGDNILFWILSLRMLPPVAVIVPFYLLFRFANLLDTRLGLILVYSIFNISFSVWLLKGFFDEIPRELEEAAMMDGYGPWAVFTRVSLPMVRAGLATTAIFNIIMSINEFLLALVLTTRDATTGPVGLAKFESAIGVNWGEISAAATMLVVPVIIFTILVRNQLVRGMSFGRLR